jgi:protein TonB
MGYLALLFCPDEKTARTVTHVLNDLDFQVEPCTEPFAAVKKLMAQHFDAVVVDCDNEQNATLLFKSARNSSSNQSSLAVAVVEGQAGVAKAFRIGANLVLTRPINVEQAKGTLRVARGLLRKGAEAKASGKLSPANTAPAAPTTTQTISRAPAAPIAPPPVAPPTRTASTPVASSFAKSAPKAAPAPVQAKRPPVAPPAPAAPVQTTWVEDHEPDSILDADDNDLFDTPATPAAKPQAPAASAPAAGTSKFPWQPAKPMAEPMGTALRKAAEAAAKIESENTDPAPAKSSAFIPAEEPPVASTRVSFHAAAPAPAKEKAQPIVPPPVVSRPVVPKPPALQVSEIKIEEAPAEEKDSSRYYTPVEEEPTPPTFFPGAYDQDESEGGGKIKAIVIVAMVVLLACSAAFLSWRNMNGKSSPTATPTQNVPSPASTTPKPDAGQTTEKQAPESAGSEASDITLGGAPSAPAAKPSAASKTAGKQTTQTAPEPETDNEPEVTQRLIVKNEPSSPKTKPAAPQEQEAVQEPAVALGAAPDAKSLAGLNTAANTPKPPAQVVKVSQGVMEGLILKRVQPHYPAQAMQMRIQGSVQLQATISKNGDITNLKVVSGDGILARAAQDAVKQWKYKPYYLNGDPVEIQTQILVNFKLPN